MKKRAPARQAAFSLVEVVLALAIMSFCLVILLGILPVSLGAIKNASEETSGINVISTVVGDLKATPATVNLSPNYQLILPTSSSSVTNSIVVDQAGGLLTGANAAGARYKVTVILSAPSQQNTITGLARVAWPAQAATPTATVESFFALNRNQ